MNSLFVNPENKGSNIADTVSAIQDEAWRQRGDEPSRSSNSGIFIVIPAYNEGPVIQEILFTLASNRDIKEIGCQAVIVDDGSTDDTWKNVVMFISSSGSINEENRLENRLEVHLLHHVVNLGQGAALATGIQYALAEGAQMIVTFDADGQHLVEDIPSLVAPISAGLADVAKMAKAPLISPGLGECCSRWPYFSLA
jgi:glycosyltransferase involved in cell wall biosynthesis